MLFNRILINLALLAQGKIKVRDIPPKIVNRVFNYSRWARHTKRSRFAINDVIFRTSEGNDETRYREFINNYFKRNAAEAENKIPIPKYNGEAFCYVALCRNRIVGKVEFRKAPLDIARIWQISGLSVLEDFRGYGIGEELLKRGISAINKNSPTVFLDVNKDNIRALKLYRKLGFKVANEQEKIKIKTMKFPPHKIIMIKGV
jgi:ribosomal protein S18 acetylase RimI-like enzyme